MPPKLEAKKQIEQCKDSIIQTRNQKKVAEANARAVEEEIRANTNAERAEDLELQLGALKAELNLLTQGYEEMEKELADRVDDYNNIYGEEVVMMSMDSIAQLAELLNKQPKRDEMMDKFSEIYSHQRKTDIPLFDGIVSKEKLIEDWLREGLRVARTAGWSDEMKLRMLSDRLTKMALRFHEELIKKKPNMTFAEWKKEMKAGFKNDAEIERRKKELSNFKQTPSHRVRDFISLIDEQYIRAYGKKLAESKDPDVIQLRENTKKDIVYKGLLPPIAEELWHRTSASTSYDELIKLAKEVEEILNRKALLRPELTINKIAASEDLEEEFDGLTIDEINSSSQITSATPLEVYQANPQRYTNLSRREQDGYGYDTCERHIVNSINTSTSKNNRDFKPVTGQSSQQWRGSSAEYRPNARPDTPISRHSRQPDYPRRFQPRQPAATEFRNPVRRQLNFGRSQTEESSSRPWMPRRTTGHQASSSPDLRSNFRRPFPPGESNGRNYSVPKDYKYNNQTFRSFRTNRFAPHGARSEATPNHSKSDSSEAPHFSGKCYGCGTEGHIRRNCPQPERLQRGWSNRLSN